MPATVAEPPPSARAGARLAFRRRSKVLEGERNESAGTVFAQAIQTERFHMRHILNSESANTPLSHSPQGQPGNDGCACCVPAEPELT